MGSTRVFAKTILIPAAIALSIYILASCVIIPFFRRLGEASRDLEEGFMDDSDEQEGERSGNGRGGRL
ncbi:hypothetical protein Pdw03_0354 [Penicillium digitatum]|uniref:Uncharacterized protein n=1 Tax=Penicillium digitatum TaxID=36651 RepID=A0A7T7BMX2_PENDI|nr:hypothetical protein Pdw03_0354 [Penicillium digitatum]